ncbi:MAG: hypothetical protein HDT11_01030 [Helicobacter sp.]|nr:hypothetical protein [Helicobacter sp.]MBD5167471.1 hypothetical protein [Helicobacter sp.]MDE5817203.1 hypothetical protein [Helicobacter sp.]MDE6045448.1 hypothetical protein [Helicobacter sp.]MDE7196579.1 hypothetical protein [Helicobacter sp.]
MNLSFADSLLTNNSVSQYANVAQRRYHATEAETESPAPFAAILEEKLQDFAQGQAPQQSSQTQLFASRASGLYPNSRG